jgi:membrane protease YdiL (CAAX protease family)
MWHIINFLYVLTRNNYIARLQFSLKNAHTTVIIASVVGIVSISYLPIPTFSFFDAETLTGVMSDTLENNTDIFTFIYVVLIAPVFEEIIFRGLILRGLSARYSPLYGIILSSALFTQLYLTLIDTFLFALFIGWVYHRTQNLLYCILMHSAVNAVAFGMRIIVIKDLTTVENLNNFIVSNHYRLAFISLVIFSLCTYILHRAFVKNRPTSSLVNNS